jgi:hypothetical protein
VRHATAAAGVDALVAGHDPSDYNGAWLLVGDRTSLYFVDFTGPQARVVDLPPGIHVLENRTVDEPSPKVDLVRASLGSPDGGDAMVEAFRGVLIDHRIPEGDERANSANCVHLEQFGTRSSCLVRVGTDPSELPRVWVADGPPCTTPYMEVGALWGADGAGGVGGAGGADAQAAQTIQSRTSGL